MARFSERYGHKPIKFEIQKDDIDADLANGLWNQIHKYFLSCTKVQGGFSIPDDDVSALVKDLWEDFFKTQSDTIPWNWGDTVKEIKEFYFKSNWWEIYDFTEFIAQRCSHNKKERFISACNQILERELSGYRFVKCSITPITDDIEISTIESATNISSQFGNVSEHIKTSLGKLSDRQNPDYRNSIKESISAVEALCRILTDNPKATLGDLLAEMDKLHPAMKRGFSALYGYTSDANGIRHSLGFGENLADFEDAKYMLVSCAGFVNYLIGKQKTS
ncbi:MAG: hypothetical protein KDD61_00625 [Bdellovibrionales bacterium]|nr:hypothetical protein [Bdellovibrionales bacterium]